MDDAKLNAIKDAAAVGAAYFTALIEERLTRDDAMTMANNFVMIYLIVRGVIPKIDEPPKEPWQE